LNMWNISRVILLGLFAILTLLPQFALAAEPYAVTVEHGVAVKMRDGTLLHADIYWTAVPGSSSVLLERTPYDNQNGVDFGHKGRPAVTS
jgi:predicted acyl esterase